MSEVSFKSQATPVQETAQASGSQQQQQDPQVVIAELGARLKELESKHGVTQKRVDDSQEYIKQLKAERDAALEAANRAKKVDDVFSALTEEPKGQQQEREVRASIDPEELLSKAEQRVLARLQADAAKKASEDNLAKVQSELTKMFGDDVDNKAKEVAAESDLTLAELQELAKQKPQMVLKMFKAEVKAVQQQSKPTMSSMRGQTQQKPAKLPDFKLGDVRSMMEYGRAMAAQIEKE